jgi:hypothetical protein
MGVPDRLVCRRLGKVVTIKPHDAPENDGANGPAEARCALSDGIDTQVCESGAWQQAHDGECGRLKCQ